QLQDSNYLASTPSVTTSRALVAFLSTQCLDAVVLGLFIRGHIWPTDDDKAVAEFGLTPHQFGLVETASDALPASFFDNLFNLWQGLRVGGLVCNVGLVDIVDHRTGGRAQLNDCLGSPKANDDTGAQQQ